MAIAIVGAWLFAASAAQAVTCGTCDDTGYVLAKCEKCRGKGQCLVCGGKGVRLGMMSGGGEVTCQICRGTGLCKYCGGAGVDQTKKSPCPDCGGKAKPPPTGDGGGVVKKTPGSGSAKSVTCSVCNGTGKLSGACINCSGGGKCRMCAGSGRRASTIRLGQEIMCIACKGSGKCKECNGTGNSLTARICAICDGTGHVMVEPGAGLIAISPPEPPDGDSGTGASTAANAARGKSNAGKMADIDAYVQTVASLDRLYAGGQAVEKLFNDAWRERASSVGKLFRSDVYLLQAHARGVRVATGQSELSSGGRLILPRSPAIVRKAEKVLQQVGECGRVVIIYGVVNGENVTLFDVEAATVEPVSDPSDPKPERPPA